MGYFGLILALMPVLAMWTATAMGQEAELPPGGRSLAGDDPLRLLVFAGAEREQARMEMRRDEAGKPLVRVSTLQPTRQANAIMLRLPNTDRIHQGDVLYAGFRARLIESSSESGDGRLEVHWHVPGVRSLSDPQAVSFGPQWQSFHFPVRSSRVAAQAGAAVLALRLGNTGTGVQTVEIADLTVLNYGQRILVGQLPVTRFTYEGREADAAWRTEALQRIEEIRKADLVVRVLDARGRAVPDATVTVQMRRHQFRFGSAVNDELVLSQHANAQAYRDWFVRLFNTAIFENSMKWQAQYGPRFLNHDSSRRVIEQFLNPHHIPIIGHVLIWPGQRWLPDVARQAMDDPPRLRELCLERIAFGIEHFRDLGIHEWQVVNEPIAHQDVQKVLGDDVIGEWYRHAVQVRPEGRYWINEFQVLTGRHYDGYRALIRRLLAEGVRIDGIGLQGHFTPRLPIPQIKRRMDELWQEFGLPMMITEFDCRSPDDQLQGDFVRDMLILTFSHPAMEGFVMWGFWDGRHWLNDAPLFNRDWSLKPGGQQYMDLVLNQWWTNLSGATDHQGQFQGRGFLGDYTITVTHNGLTKTVPATLTKEGTTTTIVF